MLPLHQWRIEGNFPSDLRQACWDLFFWKSQRVALRRGGPGPLSQPKRRFLVTLDSLSADRALYTQPIPIACCNAVHPLLQEVYAPCLYP